MLSSLLYVYAFCGVLLVIYFIILAISNSADEKEYSEIRSKMETIVFEYYEKILKQHNAPSVLIYKFNMYGYEVSLWVDDENMYFISSERDVSARIEEDKNRILEIDLDDIEQVDPKKYIYFGTIELSRIRYFKLEGNIYTETRISGGGGGGSSVGGAIVGGIVAGNTGAIIASRRPNEGIRSNTITHDGRQVLVYYDSEIDGKLTSKEMSYGAYPLLMQYIPQKEYQFVLNQSSESKISDESNIQKIKELASLMRDGIVTEEEFNQKKAQLLDKL